MSWAILLFTIYEDFLYWEYQTSGMEHHISKDLGIRVTPRCKVDKK